MQPDQPPAGVVPPPLQETQRLFHRLQAQITQLKVMATYLLLALVALFAMRDFYGDAAWPVPPWVVAGVMLVGLLLIVRLADDGNLLLNRLLWAAFFAGLGSLAVGTVTTAFNLIQNPALLLGILAGAILGLLLGPRLDGTPKAQANTVRPAPAVANQDQVLILYQGVEAWNAWRQENSLEEPALQDANFAGALLPGADLKRANLQGTFFQGANLEGGDFRGADLSAANLIGANLKKANFQGAIMANTDFTGANLTAANFQGAFLKGAYLTGAIAVNTNCQGADLQGADLNRTNCNGANFAGAYLQGAHMKGADLDGATLERANLERAVDLTTGQLRKVASRHLTILDTNEVERGTPSAAAS